MLKQKATTSFAAITILRILLLLYLIILLTGCAHRDELRGKAVVITGASGSFGKATALTCQATSSITKAH